jgi:hypothetical protein
MVKSRRRLAVRSIEMHTGFWWGNMTDGDHLEDPGLDGRIILKRDLKEM